LAHPILKRFSVKIGSQNGGFRKFKGLNIKQLSRLPNDTSLPGTTSSDVFCVKIRLGV